MNSLGELNKKGSILLICLTLIGFIPTFSLAASSSPPYYTCVINHSSKDIRFVSREQGYYDTHAKQGDSNQCFNSTDRIKFELFEKNPDGSISNKMIDSFDIDPLPTYRYDDKYASTLKCHHEVKVGVICNKEEDLCRVVAFDHDWHGNAPCSLYFDKGSVTDEIPDWAKGGPG